MNPIYKKGILDNGLRLVTCEMPQMQSVALGIWVNVGGRFETEEDNGIAHFLEHLVFKGSKKYSCRRIKESIEGIGGTLNGFTGEEFCCYLAKLPHPYINLALDILSDMVLNPSLPESDIERERNVIIEEIKMHQDLPQSYVHQLLDGLLWSGEPLGMSILGTVESVNRLDRKALSFFKKRYYTSPNIVIAACGNLDHAKILHKIKKLFRISGHKKKNQFKKINSFKNRPKLKIYTKDTEQTHLALGFHGLKRNHPQRFALGLLHVILGANMSSRLFHEVREKKGLAYEIGTQVKHFTDTGSFIVNAGIDNKNVTSSLKLILKELDNLKDDLVSQYEFKRAKEFYIGQLSIALEDTLDHMFWIGESLLTLDRTFTLDYIINEVSKIKSEDLKSLARDIFKKENRYLAIIGPLEDKERQLYECLQV